MTAPVCIRLVSDPLYLSGVREMVAAIARRIGFADDGCCHIALAIDEVLCNIMRHGYQGQTDRPIWVSIHPHMDGDDPGIDIVIEDEARQVEPDQIKSRCLDEIRPGGLGVHIIKEVMDDVLYEKRSPTGMRVTLRKRCRAANSRCAEECDGA